MSAIRILKERLFGLTNNEGNHGEDVKEYYFYLDATPTSSYLKFLYKYPQAEFPYDQLRAENAKRTRNDPEFELLDTGIFNESRYFDIFIEYAKVVGRSDSDSYYGVQSRAGDGAAAFAAHDLVPE